MPLSILFAVVCLISVLSFPAKSAANSGWQSYRCGAPNPVKHGSMSIIGEGAYASYLCNPGFALYGARKLRCLGNGQWSEDSPLCVGKIFESIISVSYKQSVPKKETEVQWGITKWSKIMSLSMYISLKSLMSPLSYDTRNITHDWSKTIWRGGDGNLIVQIINSKLLFLLGHWYH